MLTVEKIKSFEVASNVGNDYSIGASDDQGEIVDVFPGDNFASDSIHLYIAANTASLLHRPKDDQEHLGAISSML